MRLVHVALVCSSEENSDKFYRDLLGMEKINTKTLPTDLARQIFKVDADLGVVNYTSDTLHFEIFIDSRHSLPERKIDHVCLEVDDLQAFLEKCHAAGANVLQVPKGEKVVTFISDFDGNLFELI